MFQVRGVFKKFFQERGIFSNFLLFLRVLFLAESKFFSKLYSEIFSGRENFFKYSHVFKGPFFGRINLKQIQKKILKFL